MKLADISTVAVLSEGHVNPNALMALQHVLATGTLCNKFEELVLAKFVELINNGTFWKVDDPLFCNDAIASVSTMSAMKALPPDDLRKVAARVLQIASDKNSSSYTPGMSVAEWIRMVIAREATD